MASSMHHGDAMGDIFRWFHVGPGGAVTEPLTLSDARRCSLSAGDRTALYPVVEG